MPEGKGFITMEAMKGLMEIQEHAFRSMVEIMFNGLKDDIKEIRTDVQDLRSSLECSQTNITAIETKVEIANSQSNLQSKAVEEHVNNVSSLHDQIEYLENQSRRNNSRIDGVDDLEDEDESWEKSEEVVKKLVNDTLELTDDLQIERAHHVGKKRNKEGTCPDGSKYGPCPIVAKCLSWKQREKVL